MPEDLAELADDGGDGSCDEDDYPDIFYVAKKVLEECRERLSKSLEITEELVQKLVNSDSFPDEEVMVPVDMRGCGDVLEEDLESMVQAIGAKAGAEAFVKAADYFEANKDGEDAEDRPQPMTAGEWRTALADDDEDEESEEESGETPPAKRARTS
eukprot:gnl/TRDRNA2_/TRDRNA2_105056_c0_seq1.p1 gnl/TRDRNA2_/TRDRNA2_105056_c0~~gnl/TRDRNA2_/TRDRNA2_105056_c0_seq1.p1  ORF type:complete len:170 (+),score=57.01 gnl/TRDRNA2_/TRDRNA2_105056_c0_seq1:45-512(+)